MVDSIARKRGCSISFAATSFTDNEFVTDSSENISFCDVKNSENISGPVITSTKGSHFFKNWYSPKSDSIKTINSSNVEDTVFCQKSCVVEHNLMNKYSLGRIARPFYPHEKNEQDESNTTPSVVTTSSVRRRNVK
eukprot:GHVL01014655.1.p1 GENE.GHVL01014655.1~~GHVL01014655.1.p1  ORF type:complete len:136 (+),score=17.34 GHVL01014655.1:45-452(+)